MATLKQQNAALLTRIAELEALLPKRVHKTTRVECVVKALAIGGTDEAISAKADELFGKAGAAENKQLMRILRNAIRAGMVLPEAEVEATGTDNN